MKAGKVKAYNEAHYKAIQERLFKVGYEWIGGDKEIRSIKHNGIKFPYLYFDENGTIVRDNGLTSLKQHQTTEYTLDDLYSEEFMEDDYFHFGDDDESIWGVVRVGEYLSTDQFERKELIVIRSLQAELVEEDGWQRIRFKKK